MITMHPLVCLHWWTLPDSSGKLRGSFSHRDLSRSRKVHPEVPRDTTDLTMNFSIPVIIIHCKMFENNIKNIWQAKIVKILEICINSQGLLIAVHNNTLSFNSFINDQIIMIPCLYSPYHCSYHSISSLSSRVIAYDRNGSTSSMLR